MHALHRLGRSGCSQLGFPRVSLAVAMPLVGLACLGGCGPSRATVEGTVRVDGVPLERGSIIFQATDAEYRETRGGRVESGAFCVTDLPTKQMNAVVMVEGKTAPIAPGTAVTLVPGKQVLNLELPAPKRR